MSNIIDTIRVSGTDYTLSATSSGGNPTVELTQAEYDALVESGTVQTDTYYIITDASPADISQYWTSAQTNSAITAAVSGKQDTLSAGTGIDITDNVISATGGSGGGKAIEAGRGISVTTGETADTVSFDLPIYDGGGTYSIREGSYTTANGNQSHAEGYGTSANGMYSHAEGQYTKTSNKSEHASGQYNVSSSGSSTFGNSGNTLFSVGNGTSTSARHNAFEIRQNGDIYLTSGGTDIKLQDHLGGGGGGGKAVSGGTNISITTGETADTINCTLPIKISSTNNTSIIIGNTNQNISANYSVAEGSGGFIGDTSNCSHKEGLDCKINNYAIASHVEGNNCEILTNSKYSHAEGNYTKTANESEHASGQYNVSNKASTTFGNSGNTLFSVGNGTANNARHNAFEIRQNGDIYFNDGASDVKLQDKFSTIETTIGDINTILQSI